MKLKRLEIHGFKSFKDKTVIHFDHGITGIVGPNGCGKSNVVDAFFWVMGEQSYKQMRGSGSEDLIFNGSSKYAPLAIAEATLVMEVEEIPEASHLSSGEGALTTKKREISVTRRVYRDGQGEYLINGQTSRLKDIHELFLDTGAGSKGYSIIEQGQIGKIVNSKPEDRRVLIEEAAGIAKYKARKKESLRKIDSTHTNLGRLNDVIQEIERNLSSLDRQAQKARLYKRYKEELSDKELTWGRRKAKVIQERLNSAEKRKFIKEAEITQERATLQVIENQLESDRLEQLNDSKLADEIQLLVDQLSETLRKDQSEDELNRQRVRFLGEQRSLLEKESHEITEFYSIQNQKIADTHQEIDSLSLALSESSETLSKLLEQQNQLKLNLKNTEFGVNQKRQTYYDYLQRESHIATQIATIRSRIESQTELCARLSSQRESLEEKVSSIEADIQKNYEKLADLQTIQANHETSFIEQSSNLKVLEIHLADLQFQKQTALEAVTQLKSKLHSLNELETNFEGYSAGAKHVLQSIRENQLLKNSLYAYAPLLSTEVQYQTALEAWLDFATDEIVIADPKNVDNVGALLDELKSEKLGRVTFRSPFSFSPEVRIISEIKDQIEEELKSQGVNLLGTLSSFTSDRMNAEIRDELRAQLKLDRVWITDQLPVQIADTLQTLCRHGVSLVTLDGQVLKGTGEIKGGASRPSTESGVLGRSIVIEAIESELVNARTKLEKLELEVITTQEGLNKLRDACEETKRSIQSIQFETGSIESQSKHLDLICNNLKGELTSGEQEYHRLVAEQKNLEEKLQDLAETELTHKQARTELEATIQNEESSVASLNLESNQLNEAVSEKQILQTSFQERLRSTEKTLSQLLLLRSEKENRFAEIDRLLLDNNAEVDKLESSASPLLTRIQDSVHELGILRERLSILKDRLEKSASSLNEVLERIRTGHATIDQDNRELSDLAVVLERLCGELSHLKTNLEEKYGQGCLEDPTSLPIQEEMEAPVVTEAISAEEEQLLGEEVEKLRERIRRLGEVNLMAIDEFEETKKRHDSLLHERSDLNTSLDHLNQAILHINQISEARFKSAFETIANRFGRLFPIIFGGGHAELSLSYPEGSTDILDAGVEILAQPPGKKIANIALLSGGEKALTAICMIFAIFMVKPSPFCILDEVDAPLDDTNIGKFNALLREMSSSSQFVVITHNKKTMELNDSLYGVTMEEPGVSKMVSIELH